MGKIKLEKDKKKPIVAVEAPKDRVKVKSKAKPAKKQEKPKIVKEEKEHAGNETDNEGPEALPIEKTDVAAPVAGKNKKKKNKKNKGAKGKEDGSLLKIKETGKVSKVDKLAQKLEKVTKKLKHAAKNVTPKAKDAEIEDPADPPNEIATKDAIRTAVIALRKATEEEAKDKKKLFDKDFKYCIQIAATKIPKVPTRTVRLLLPNSLYDDTDDICLFVRDDVRGKQHDPELTANKYEKLFREQKIDFIKKVMPLRELKENYGPYEMKRKLAQTYDLFLADSIISGMVFGFCGKALIEKRKTPIPIKIKYTDESKLKDELLKGIRKTQYKQQSHGPTIAIEVATHRLSVEQFTENIESVLEQLKSEFPGGWVNIKNVYLKPMMHSVVSLPLYISEIDPNRVPVPVVVGPKYRHLMKMANKLENDSKKFKLEKGFKLEKKKGTKRPAENESGENKKIKKEADEGEEQEEKQNDDSGVQSEDETNVKEETEEKEDVKPKAKKQKKNKKNKNKAGATQENVGQSPVKMEKQKNKAPTQQETVSQSPGKKQKQKNKKAEMKQKNLVAMSPKKEKAPLEKKAKKNFAKKEKKVKA
uniref:CSON013798 protein n=1 Tax=Culicoides sonorensis TaxID=179676 RepID=A0A336MCU7_CULSO